MSPIIELTDVSKNYEQKRFFKTVSTQSVLDDISFSVNEGERIGFIGPNGSGKSTTIKILSGIIRPTKGNVRVNAIEPTKNRTRLAYDIGVVFGHCQQMYSHLTVEQNFYLNQTVYGMTEEAYQKRLITLDNYFGILELFSKNASKLSLGQKMKCEISLSLLHDPKIIFLDEPTIGLDVQAKLRFRQILKEMSKEENKTLILTSHDMDDIEDICERIIMINAGKMVFDGSISNLKKYSYKTKTIHIVTTAFPKDFTLPGCDITSKSEDDVKIEVYLDKISLSDALSHIVNTVPFVDISVESESLESIIKDMYDAKQH
jgi:ABC-2 type transport system ATP-binding protein